MTETPRSGDSLPDTPDPGTAPDPGTPAATTGPVVRRSRPRPAIAARHIAAAGAAVLIVALKAAVIAVAVGRGDDDSLEDVRRDAMAKAREVAGLMFTYSPETVRANVDKVQPMLTGDAAQQFETVLSDNQFVFVVDKNNVTSTLSIADAGIVEAHKDSATVLLFMDQTVSRKDADTTSVVPSRLEMDVVKHGGGWKVSTLSLISDDSISKAIPAASAAPTSPSRTTTAPSTPTG